MDLSEFVENKNYITLPRAMLNNSYYQWVLRSLDIQILLNLIACISYDNRSPMYRKGLLVANIRESKLIAKIGRNDSEKNLFDPISSATIRRRTTFMSDLGLFFKCRRKYSNNYILGFRTDAEGLQHNNYLFAYYLCVNYENKLLEYKSTKDIEVISMPKDLKNYISDNYNDPDFFKTVLPGGKRIFDELFGVRQYIGWSEDQIRNNIIPLRSNRD